MSLRSGCTPARAERGSLLLERKRRHGDSFCAAARALPRRACLSRRHRRRHRWFAHVRGAATGGYGHTRVALRRFADGGPGSERHAQSGRGPIRLCGSDLPAFPGLPGCAPRLLAARARPHICGGGRRDHPHRPGVSGVAGLGGVTDLRHARIPRRPDPPGPHASSTTASTGVSGA